MFSVLRKSAIQWDVIIIKFTIKIQNGWGNSNLEELVKSRDFLLTALYLSLFV